MNVEPDYQTISSKMKFLCFLILTTAALTVNAITASNPPQLKDIPQNNDCSKCQANPPECDRRRHKAPVDGGPPCTCGKYNFLNGCVVEPCEDVTDPTRLCDCSAGGGDQKEMCLRYRCAGKTGECEVCKREFPPNCIIINLLIGPAKGGPECSCNSITPSGCTLKPCPPSKKGRGRPMYKCICNPDVVEPYHDNCMEPRCPGSNSSSIDILNEISISNAHQATTVIEQSSCLSSTLQDCDPYQLSPWNGGPPCLCTNQAPHQGCVLKPCKDFNDTLSLCDNSEGGGMGKKFAFAYATQPKTQEYPPDCLSSSYNHPPANGGPPCSCSGGIAPTGCTMKLCEYFIPGFEVPCICDKTRDPINSYCFSTKCSNNPDSITPGGGGGHKEHEDSQKSHGVVDHPTTDRTEDERNGASEGVMIICQPFSLLIGIIYVIHYFDI